MDQIQPSNGAPDLTNDKETVGVESVQVVAESPATEKIDVDEIVGSSADVEMVVDKDVTKPDDGEVHADEVAAEQIDGDVDMDKLVTQSVDEDVNVDKVVEPPVAQCCVEDWSAEEDYQLYECINKCLPKDDKMKYDSRINNIKWELVSLSFDDRTANDCKNRWIFTLKHLRHHRVTSELIPDAIAWRKQSWKNFNRSSKDLRHPDCPKKPLTSFFIFHHTVRSEVTEKYSDLSTKEVVKLIGEMFKDLPEAEKQKYVDQSVIQKEEYEKKMIKFLQDHPEYIADNALGKSRLPRAPTPFNLYVEGKRQKYVDRGMTPGQARQLCSGKFKSMPDKKKINWIRMAIEQEEAYKKEFQRFVALHPDDKFTMRPILSKEEIRVKEKCEGKPEKPPKNGFVLFYKELIKGKEFNQLDSETKRVTVTKMWKNLHKDKRNEYKDSAKLKKEKFDQEIVAYEKARKRAAARSASDDSEVPKKKRKDAKMTVAMKFPNKARTTSSSKAPVKQEKESDKSDSYESD